MLSGVSSLPRHLYKMKKRKLSATIKEVRKDREFLVELGGKPKARVIIDKRLKPSRKFAPGIYTSGPVYQYKKDVSIIRVPEKGLTDRAIWHEVGHAALEHGKHDPKKGISFKKLLREEFETEYWVRANKLPSQGWKLRDLWETAKSYGIRKEEFNRIKRKAKERI